MTFHKTRSRRARGAVNGAETSPRIAVSLPAEDMAILTWWAQVKGIPASQVLRNAVDSYFAPFKNNPALKKQYGSSPKA